MAGADWRSVLRDRVQVKAATTREEQKAASNIFRISRVAFSVAAHPFLVRAAAKRGISLSGYIRRATMAFVARDLGLNQLDLFEIDAGVTPVGRRGAPSKDLDGALYGTWEVCPDVDRGP